VDCIEHTQKASYGTVCKKVDGKWKTHGIHRQVFFDCTGWWPKVVMHTCDNPRCVNPTHLVGGTQKNNIQDACRKGRMRGSGVHGERVGTAKLTTAQVRSIRQDSRAHRTIAKEYPVGHATIGSIKRGETWGKTA